MTDKLVISAIGEDRPGIVNDLSDIIFKLSLNIEDSRMSVLGGEFAIQLLVSGDKQAIEALHTQLSDIESRLGLNVMAKPTKGRSSEINIVPYSVEVSSLDHQGIVHNIAKFFSSRNINIVDLHTERYAAPHTGSPMFALQMASSVMNALLNNQLRFYGGDLAISVVGIIHAVALFFAMPIFGLNQGAQPIIGYNYGAGKFDRVKKTLQTAILFATAICLTGYLAVMLFPELVISLFHRGDTELLMLGTRAIRICLLMFPIIGFQIVSASYFQAVGKPKRAMLLGLSRQVLILIPAILIMPYFFGLDGLFAAIPLADLASSLLTGACLLIELRHLDDRHVASDA